jgi:acetoin utilization protein AcuC
MDIFYEEPRVLYLSVHQDPHTMFPNTGFIDQIGRGEGEGYTVNVPLPPEAYDSCMDLVLDRVFKPLVREFRPQVVIRCGGADPHFQDELADLALTFRGLWSVGRAVVEEVERAGCPLVDLLCSGYNPGTEVQGLYALFSGELGAELDVKESQAPEPEDPKLLEKTADVIDELAKILKPYWTLG